MAFLICKLTFCTVMTEAMDKHAKTEDSIDPLIKREKFAVSLRKSRKNELL